MIKDDRLSVAHCNLITDRPTGIDLCILMRGQNIKILAGLFGVYIYFLSSHECGH